MLYHGWPDRSGEVVAGRRDCYGDAATCCEPKRNIGHDRSKSGRGAGADDHVTQRESPQPGRYRGGKKTEREGTDPQQSGSRDAESVLQPAHDNTTAREAEHSEREWQ